MGKLEQVAAERLGSASELLEALDAADEEITPPQTVGREIIEWMEFSETGISHDELPRPQLWRVLIFPKQPKKFSAGGIALPTAAQNVEAHLNYIGQVVALGPLAGKSEKFQNPDWPGPGAVYPHGRAVSRYLWDVKVGDWVIYGRYSGQATEYKGVRLLTVNDDDIVQTIKSPADFKVYV